MRMGIVVNVMEGESAGQTTYRLAVEATARGHEVWVMVPSAFTYEEDDTVRAHAHAAPPGTYRTAGAFVEALRGPRGRQRRISVDDLDVLLLRSNPSAQRPWAQAAGISFGRLAMRHGVLVLNDPNGLTKAMNKLYLQTFPEAIRPATVITRSTERILAFAAKHGRIVIKPLQGYGGKGVFMLHADRLSNVDEMVNAVTRDGYAVAQEYLPAAAEGDTRLFLMNGLPLRHRGHDCAFRRIRTGDDLRSNIHAGGRLRRAEVDETMRRLADMVRPRLVEDGMFLVGLDIVGDKVMEVNVFSPGGIGSAQKFAKVDFAVPIIDSIEHKVRGMGHYHRRIANIDMATL